MPAAVTADAAAESCGGADTDTACFTTELPLPGTDIPRAAARDASAAGVSVMGMRTRPRREGVLDEPKSEPASPLTGASTEPPRLAGAFG